MTDLRAAAIQIRTAAQDQDATYDQCINAVESVLREVVSEAKSEVGSFVHIPGLNEHAERIKEARSEALEQAAKIAEETKMEQVWDVNMAQVWIAGKNKIAARVRALKP